jgi:uncharacterized membrane protein
VPTLRFTDSATTTMQDKGFGAMPPSAPLGLAKRWLRVSTALWLTVAVTGQLLFGYYVLVFYGGAAWRGDIERWSKIMPRGWVSGDDAGNAAVAMHLVVALVISLGGATQLIPWIRRSAPAIHRWMGRVFVSAASLGALSGFWLQWVRGGSSALPHRLGTTTNGVVILVCAWQAWRTIRRREMSAHRQWALRLYLASNGVWFFRIGLMFTLLAFGGPVGFDPETFRGPLLTGLAWAETIVPLAILEVWLRVDRSPVVWRRWLMTGAMGFLAIATGMGIAGAVTILWWPNL